jgi:hypothetical protein
MIETLTKPGIEISKEDKNENKQHILFPRLKGGYYGKNLNAFVCGGQRS